MMSKISALINKIPYLICIIAISMIYAISSWFIVHKLDWSPILLTILVALLLVCAICVILFVNPVKRDRFLFARKGGGMLWLSLCIIVLVLSSLYFFSSIWSVSPKDVFSSENGSEELIWNIVSQFADPGNLYQSKSQGSTVALISALAGILCLSGLLVSSLVSWISKRSNRWSKGFVHYKSWVNKWGFNHYVVIVGVNNQTSDIVKQSLREGARYVLIQTKRDVEKAREQLELKLERKDEGRVVFYYGDRALEEDVKDIRLERAREVYILGEDVYYENEEDHDAYNISCLEHIAAYMEKHRHSKDNRLRCHVNLEYQSTFMAFKFTHVYRGLNESVEFLPFNVHELWAKKVLVDGFAVIPTGKGAGKKVVKYKPIDMYWKEKDGKRESYFIQQDSEQCVHLVIAGMNQMGVALAMQAALLVHLPNFHSDKRRRTTITFIDENAVKEGEFLKSRYDALFSLCHHRTIKSQKTTLSEDKDSGRMDFATEWSNPAKEHNYAFEGDGDFMDLQWEFIEGNIASEIIRSYISALVQDIEHRTVTIAICFNNPQQSIAAALYLPEIVFKRAVQVLVYQKNSFDMIDKVATTEKEWKRYEKLIPFGIIEGCYTERAFDNILAKYANMVYADKDLTPDSTNKKYFGKSYLFRTKRLWEELGIVDKYANIDLVDSFAIKMRSLAGTAENLDGDLVKKLISQNGAAVSGLAKSEHLRWLTERLTMGYRPLEKKEYEEYSTRGQKGYKYSKRYYQNKSRAHVDICPGEELPTRDPKAVERDMDRTLIRMIPLLQQLCWSATIRGIRGIRQRKKMVSRVPGATVRDMVRDMVTINMGDNIIAFARHPVTIEQWRMVMGSYPNDIPNKRGKKYVDYVSWHEVQDFLILLRKKTGLPFDLPKVDEWNKAFENREMAKIKDMEGVVWQWTKSHGEEYESSIIFCGKSKEFERHGWGDNFSYWLPDFKSKELGIRLVLRINIPIEELSNSGMEEAELDDRNVIENMISKMVLVEVEGSKSFRILPTPVTQRQWKSVMYYGNSQKSNPSFHQGDYYPLENITWAQAEKFVKELNKLEFGTGFSLPSSSQWKQALRKQIQQNGGGTIWHSGLAKSTHEVINYKSPDFKDGVLYDMLGNVWEWCCDKPAADKGDFCRNMQGGSWRFSEDECRREEGSYWLKEDYKADDLGFRIIIREEDYQKVLERLNANEKQ